MARFYGSIEGQAKTEATRRGSPSSGMRCHIRGWNVGIRVCLEDHDGKDRLTVYKTGGSNGASLQELIATIEA
jgi:hypothetical protein